MEPSSECQDLPPSYEQSTAGGFIPPKNYPQQPQNDPSPSQIYPPPSQIYPPPPHGYSPPSVNYPPPPQNYPPPIQNYPPSAQNYPPPPQNYPPPPITNQPASQSYPAPAQGTPSPSNDTVQQVIVQTIQPPDLGHRPTTLTCPNCQNQVTTTIESEPSAITWIACGLLCFAGLWCCSCVPFCIDSLKNVTHKCPSCSKVMGKYKGVKL